MTDPGQEQRGLSREDWIGAGRRVLIEKGIAGIRLRALSESLGATTGAFYWQYRKLEDLLEDIRQDWARRNTDPFTRSIAAAGPSGMRQYLAYVRTLVLEDEFNPRYDNAIREWAHSDPRTAEVLRDIEIFRIDQLRAVFEAMGFEGRSALIRARVTYFHQAGYNAMQITETLEQRLQNIPYYAEILTDRRDLLPLDSAAAVQDFLLDPPGWVQ
ncbi:MAG: TetR/AcrR family transcriptional regulator [Alphaproteobacteria bacterium]